MFASLNGFELPFDSRPGWARTHGVSPDERRFVVPFDLSVDIGMGDATLILSTETNRVRVIKNLTILDVVPTDHPDEVELIVVDSRWKWPYAHVYRTFNVRRKTGERRAIGQNVPRAAQIVVDDIGYHKWSLKKESKRWKTHEMIRRVMDDVTNYGKSPKGWETRRINLQSHDLPDLEGVLIDMTGDAAIQHMLGLLGNSLAVTVNDEGKTILFDRNSPFADSQLGLSTGDVQTIIDTPQYRFQNREVERPSAVHVFFERIMELRIEGDPITSVAATAPRPTAANVVKTPEDLTIGKRQVIRGTWLSVDDFLLGLKGKGPVKDLTKAIINKGWLAPVLQTGFADPVLDITGQWSARIATIKDNYRLTYQIDRPWRDRIKTIYPYRVAIEDHETATRPPAAVYVDYAEFNHWRTMLNANGVPGLSVKPANDKIIQNIICGSQANTIIGVNPVFLTPVPAEIVVVDSDQKIIKVNFKFDDTGRVKNYIHSTVKDRTRPDQSALSRNLFHQDAELVEKRQINFIVTVSMASPANNKRYHVVKVTPGMATSVMSTAANTGLGPIMQVRIDPNVSVARFAHRQSKMPQLNAAFSDFEDPTSKDDNPIATALGDPVNLEEVEAVAIAAAARVYNRFVDKNEGGVTTQLLPDLLMDGEITKITHEISPGPNGGALTTVVMDRERPPVSLRNYLPRGLRRILEHFVDEP